MKERELRLLLTQKCNFKCGFCHKEGVPKCKAEMLNAQDYAFVYNLLRNYMGGILLALLEENLFVGQI